MTRGLFTVIGVLLLSSCSLSQVVSKPAEIRLENKHLHSFDGDRLPYTTWMPKAEPDQIIIGVHGISGAASDYKPLGEHLLANLPGTAIYAAETRGQGNDPIKERRGHIEDRRDWFRDLTAFTKLIRKKHPKARIIWCGESMGSLIVMHTYANAADRSGLCDAMILSSPIVDIRGDFPKWKEYLANGLAALLPKARISLESLSGKTEVKVTKDTVHEDQVKKNPYHIQRHTLRLLTTLGNMIRGMEKASQSLDIPLYVLYGGKDVFSDPNDVKIFLDNLPATTQASNTFYPESFHLLFHDHQSDKVVADIEKWLRKLPAR
ncbi:lysophospholipase [Akkermansiaceae bacterium]|nr:lysophospholipase [Akkermansiaceae bacterium]